MSKSQDLKQQVTLLKREVLIEASLEKVRSIAMAMKQPGDMLKICKTISQQLQKLGIKEIRNVQTAIIYPHKGSYLNYEFYAKHDKLLATEVLYINHPMSRAFVKQMQSGPNGFFKRSLTEKKTKEWYAFQKTTNQFADKYLLKASSLNYYWYSLGPVALGISTYEQLNKEEQDLFIRFRNVFELAYKRFTDIEKAVAQTREAQIEAALEKVRSASLAMHHSDELEKVVVTLFDKLLELGFSFNGALIFLFEKEKRNIQLWVASKINPPIKVTLPYDPAIEHNAIIRDFWRAIEKGEDIINKSYSGKEKNNCYRYVGKHNEEIIPGSIKKMMINAKSWTLSLAAEKNSMVGIDSWSGLLITEEDFKIVKRFARVFEQAYIRFLDLQKAEAQAREAQIEAALEKVRSKSLAMHRSDEMREIVKVVFARLKELNFAIDGGVFIGIPDTVTNSFNLWVGDDHSEYPTCFNLPYYDAAPITDVWKASQNEAGFLSKIYSKKEKNKWFRFAFKHTDFKTLPEKLKDWILKQEFLTQTFALAKHSGIGIHFHHSRELAASEIDVLKRFTKVFEQGYIRFLDLQKAEVQTREAQIEASMEKVRSRSLAMQKPEELIEVAELLRKEMGQLGVEELETSSIYIISEKDTAECWYAIKDIREKHSTLVSDEMTLQLSDTWVGKKMRKFYQSGEEQTSIIMKGENRKEWINYCADRSKVLKGYYGGEIPERTYHLVKFNGGYMGAASPGTISNESWDLLKRAATVFSLAYTRFKDLQEAAARTREAQIELALERVRSRSIGMQKSEELKEVIRIVYEQLVHLDIHTEHAGFIMDYKTRDDLHIWLADQHLVPSEVTIPWFDSPPNNSIKEAKEKGLDLCTYHLNFEEKNKFYQELFKLIPGVPDETLEYYLNCPGLAGSGVLLENIVLYIENFSGTPYTDEEHEVLMRFGKVFQQTYTRFLDLQKAEAQGRESQIQLALERVRARTMAMQKSEELRQVVSVLFEQMNSLGFGAFMSTIILFNKKTREYDCLMASSIQSELPDIYRVPYYENLFMKTFTDAFGEGVPYKVLELSGKDKEDYDEYLFAETDFSKLPEETKGMMLAIKSCKLCCAYMSYGCLEAVGMEQLSEENALILQRFAKVFEQTYTRFLDLQKAEAQAREAQVQLALERVRARSMAMQRSDELAEVSYLLNKQVVELGIPTRGCAFNIYNEHDSTEWFSNIDGTLPAYKTPREKIFLKYYEASQHGETLLIEVFGKERIRQHYEYMYSLGLLGNNEDEYKTIAKAMPESQIDHVVYFKYGYLLFITLAPAPEAHDIFKRFAKEFEQTYTRFLDLQKAEAQAREAQIEVALERVRSRAMAMQSSEELSSLIGTVFTELTKLDLALTRCIIWVFEPTTNDTRWWMANSEDPFNPMSFHIKYHEHPAYLTFVKEWKNQNVKFVYDLKGQDKINWDDILFNETELRNLPDVVKDGMREPERVLLSASFNNFGGINVASLAPLSDEHFDLLLRFAKVFDLTYTRFLDLKNAEAQVRESQIQLALERVRARTMAMQKSEDMNQTAAEMFKQILSLGMQPWACGFNIFDKDEKAVTQYMSLADGGISPPFRTPLNEDPFFINIYDARKRREDLLVMESSGESLAATYRYMFSLPGSKEIFGDLENSGFEMPKFQITHCAYFSQGYLVFITYEQVPEAHDIFKRFAKVFEQTYTRFLDLQKAEAQARESQIQLAMERVRARTMAMQKSNELTQASNLLFQQMQSLEIPAWSAGYCIWDNTDKTSATFWMSSEGILQPPFSLPLTENSVCIRYRQESLLGKEFYAVEYSGEELATMYNYMMKQPDLQWWNKLVAEDADRPAFPTFQVNHVVYFAHGFLLFVTHKHVPEVYDIFKRFGKVFEQTYTRFLDLQKAEAQARESQIQLALERVRARTMAMQHSDELLEVSCVLFEQFNQLGQPADQLSIGIVNEADGVIEICATVQGHPLPKIFKHSLNEPYVMNKVFNGWQTGKKSLDLELSAKELKAYNQFRNQLVGKEMFDTHIDPNQKRVIYASYFSRGMLAIGASEQLSDEIKVIMDRFAKVFEQTYTRFLDLQKAEEQARESQIQLALERVRARTMAMQHSDELKSAATLLFQQVKALGVPAYSCGYNIWEDGEKTFTSWMSTQDGNDINAVPNIPLTEDANFIRFEESRKKGEQFFVLELRGERMQEHYTYLKTIPQFKAYFDYAVAAGFDLPQTQIHHIANFSHGNLLFISLDVCPEFHDVFKRFAAVFDQTYTRFLDLQKAEAQAREAQVEASLERVRSKTMAMHNSQDVGDTAATMFAELVHLGIHTNRCGILIFDDHHSAEVWTARSNPEGKANLIIGKLNLKVHDLLSSAYKSWKSKESFHQYVLLDNDMVQYYEAINRSEYYPVKFDINTLPSKEIHSDFYFPEGAVFAFTSEPIAEEHSTIFKRFAGVFGQTYRRYLDLQKAEAQAREAQIEAALERVRSKAMAMHSSADIILTTTTAFEEIKKLGIHSIRCGIGLLSKNSMEAQVYASATDNDGGLQTLVGARNMKEHPSLTRQYQSWLKQEDLAEVMSKEELESYYNKLFFQSSAIAAIPKNFDNNEYGYYFSFADGLFYSWSDQQYTTSEINILTRFKSIVALTFRRFLDLQKAEAQAREATIEAALERVRGKAMAMHNSNDISGAAGIVFAELKKLGIKTIRAGISIQSKENRKNYLYTSTSTEQEDNASLTGWAILDDHPVLKEIYDSWIRGEDYFPVLKGDILTSYYEKIKSSFVVPEEQALDYEQYGYFMAFTHGMFYGWGENPFDESEKSILKRFTSVVDLTFKRYFDLQKAETSAKEAIRQASLDRVRAEIASMRTVDDLQRITPVIWNELTILSIPFIRCGIFIMDDAAKQMHTFLSSPDGKAIASFHLDYNAPGNISDVVTHWHNNKTYVNHWGIEQFSSLADSLVQQGAVATKEQYLQSLPADGIYLHFLPFLQGMLYVGNSNELNSDDIHLVQSVADAFSTAYARYEDFNKLEAAKRQVDNTLTDLKQAQQQLIQNEKMASLGELTAGIAHEIQNPLNFVNNFSDVSSELIKELVDEVDKGNTEEVKAIAEDLVGNLDKINHHGQRAAAIVKGMLQHSRSSSGTKEATDINALCDEYLRLAYHGLRAKDKSFNAKFETSFDDSIGKINAMPQEMGRVILNLINNAFYAVSAKASATADSNYEPTVTITTRKENDSVIISVKDNGTGIPQKVLDKIFQPFFTTKPTGQGTGLGLSLSYDIITKGHNGELKVETKEGEGTTFIIQLPV